MHHLLSLYSPPAKPVLHTNKHASQLITLILLASGRACQATQTTWQQAHSPRVHRRNRRHLPQLPVTPAVSWSTNGTHTYTLIKQSGVTRTSCRPVQSVFRAFFRPRTAVRHQAGARGVRGALCRRCILAPVHPHNLKPTVHSLESMALEPCCAAPPPHAMPLHSATFTFTRYCCRS